MEQESEVRENINEEKNFFKLDYKGQNIKKNKFFKEFKLAMLKKSNNKGLIFFCPDDNAYFYYNSQYKYHNGYCPLCRKDFCYFCSKKGVSYGDKCCLSKKMYLLFCHDGFLFLEDNTQGIKLFALVPLLNLILLVGGIHTIIYKIKDIHIRESNCYWNFEGYLKGEFDHKHWNIFLLIVVLDVGATIILIIPFAMINIIFTVVLIIISIPIKFYPINYLAGITYKGLHPYS